MYNKVRDIYLSTNVQYLISNIISHTVLVAFRLANKNGNVSDEELSKAEEAIRLDRNKLS